MDNLPFFITSFCYLVIGIPVFLLIFLLVFRAVIASEKTVDTRWQKKLSTILLSLFISIVLFSLLCWLFIRWY